MTTTDDTRQRSVAEIGETAEQFAARCQRLAEAAVRAVAEVSGE